MRNLESRFLRTPWSPVPSCGTVFKFTPSSGEITTLHVFIEDESGRCGAPLSPLLLAANGRLYAATTLNSWPVTGSLVEIRSDGTSENLELFDNGLLKGEWPNGGLIESQPGVLYGTAGGGGPLGRGTIFRYITQW